MKLSERKSARYAPVLGTVKVLGSESRKIIGSILNVGEGDLTFSFDKSNPAERVRAARIVRHMLRSGYALMIDVKGDGVLQRALDFDENTCEYIIADFDDISKGGTLDEGDEGAAPASSGKGKKETRKRVPAEKAGVVATPRSAGG